MTDPHAPLRDRVLSSVLDGVAETDRSLRHAAASGVGVPADIEPLVAKIHANAYRVTDDDVAGPQAKHGDDAVFEIIVSAALGASRRRLLAGLAALDQA